MLHKLDWSNVNIDRQVWARNVTYYRLDTKSQIKTGKLQLNNKYRITGRTMTDDDALLILDILLKPHSLNDLQELVFRQSWAGRSYAAMADETSYDENYLKDVGSRLWKLLSQHLGTRVTKNNLQSVLRQQANRSPHPIPEVLPTITKLETTTQVDWGEAIEVFSFFGRELELEELQYWIVRDHARLVALVGMGGMGKSALSIRLVEQLIAQAKFEYVIWRSLQNTPPLATLLIDLIQFLSKQQETQSSLPQEVPALIQKLMEYLRRSRCLIVLDNAETILRPGYEDYSELLRQLGEMRHQSCLLLTSREKPSIVAILEGNRAPVRSLLLRGLNAVQAQSIFQQRINFVATPTDWEAIVHQYAGNPLALKMVACAIEELFDCNVTKFVEFLQTQTLVFDDIRDLLDRQFDRLTDLEKEVMIWLAINREFVDLAELQTDLISPQSQRRLPETLKSLVRKSFIETQGKQFTQQPVVMEYITDKIIEHFASELSSWNSDIDLGAFSNYFLHRYALLKVTSKEYVRNSQIRVMLSPILERFQEELETSSPERFLKQIFTTLRSLLVDVPTYSIGNLINLMRSLNTNFTDFDFSHLFVWQADLRRIPLHRVNFQAANLEKSSFSESLGGVICTAFLPDGIHLATGDTQGTVSLWNYQTGQQIKVFDRIAAWVTSIAVSPDGKYLAAAAAATIRVWRIETGDCIHTLIGHSGWWIRRVVFSPDGQTLMSSGGEDRSIRFWNIETGQCQQVLEYPDADVFSCAFSPCSSMIAAAHGAHIMLLDRMTGQCVRTLSGHLNQVLSVNFSSDGKTLVSTGVDHLVKIWQVETGDCLHTCAGHRDQAWNAVISPDDCTIASVSNDQTVKLWSLQTGQYIRTLEGFKAHVYGVDFSSDGTLLATSSMDQTVRLWDVTTGACRQLWQGYRNESWEVKFLPTQDGYLLAGAWQDGMIRLWQLPSSQCVQQLVVDSGWVRSLHPISQPMAQSLGIERGLITAADNHIKLWNLDDGSLISEFVGHQAEVPQIIGNDRWFVSCSMDQTIRLWDIQTGECLQIFTGHQHWVFSIACSPTESLIASASLDGTAKLWDLSTGECVCTFEGHHTQLFAIVFSLDGQRVITGSADRTIKIWDIHTGTCLHTLTGHEGWISSLALSSDGRWLASGSVDNTVRLWDLQTLNCQRVLHKHSQWVLSVAFSPDGQWLVSSGNDELLHLWNVQTGEWTQTLTPERLYAGMNVTDVVGLTEAQKFTLKELGAIEAS